MYIVLESTKYIQYKVQVLYCHRIIMKYIIILFKFKIESEDFSNTVR